MLVGEQLDQLVEGAQSELLLVAPFMRVGALSKLLERCSPSVSLTCVTRWRPEEVIAGVSDLEVADVVAARTGAKLYLRPDLHAKLYRADSNILVGSANLTRRALGWTARPNLELLVSVPAADPAIEEFERLLFAGLVPADAETRASVEAAVRMMRAMGWVSPPTLPELGGDVNGGTGVNTEKWLPLCMTPDRLWDAYEGDRSVLTQSNFEDAKADLASLGIFPGLNKDAFDAFVVSALLQMPRVRAIQALISAAPRHAVELAVAIAQARGQDPTSVETLQDWTVLKAWLLALFPNRYLVSADMQGETISEGRVLGRW